MKYLILFFLSFYILIYSQSQNFIHIPTPYSEIKESFPVTVNQNELIIFYVNPTQDSIFSIKTIDSGLSWKPRTFVKEVQIFIEQELIDLTALKTNTGRLLLAWSVRQDSINLISSDDNGVTWSQPKKLTSSITGQYSSLHLSQLTNNKIILTFDRERASYIFSNDNGESWGNVNLPISQSGQPLYVTCDFNYIFVNSNFVFGIYFNGKTIYGLKTTPETLNSPLISPIFEATKSISRAKLVKTANGTLWIVFQLRDTTDIFLHYQYDIYYLHSKDNGITWSDAVRYTRYLGNDQYFNICESDNFPVITFSSERFTNKNQLALGKIGQTIDSVYPPSIIRLRVSNINPENGALTLNFEILHDNPNYIYDIFFSNNFAGNLYDDGLHNDGYSNDFIFGNDFIFPEITFPKGYLLEVNKIKLPLNNKGILADVGVIMAVPLTLKVKSKQEVLLESYVECDINTGNTGGIFDEGKFLFSSGFMMAGKDDIHQWANGSAKSSLVIDYLPGPVGSSEKDFKNRIYSVKASDVPFGESWQNWKDAVEIGAEFYDGDKDGFYTPKDFNYNGTWDLNEDMPLIIGDETIFCVYNDGVPANYRRWKSPPKQIEVTQTLFASNKFGFENIIFIRYKIENKSQNLLDSVYFGFWADSDLGEAMDDRSGCDTILNSGFTYNDSTDEVYGINPPAFFTTLLQGPVVYSKNESDTAHIKLGQQFEVKNIPSSKNLNITSSIMFIGGHPDFSDPEKASDVYNYLKGFTKTGSPINPCSFPFGIVSGGIDCNQINPKLWFSGDPVQRTGWLSSFRGDIRNLLGTGPFELIPNVPIEILSAYIIGRGIDHLNSITVARNLVRNAIEEYNNNFSSLSYISPPVTNPVTRYSLYQNYPNPFNPYTTIRFELPQDGFVTLKIYDILGSEVKTLVNEFRKSNRYEVSFDAINLASGVYFYKIRMNDFVESKKMILIK